MTINTTSTSTTDAALRSLDLINRGDTGPAVDEVIHPASVAHRSSGRGPGGRDGFRQVVRWLNEGFADLAITPEDVIAQDDKVVIRTRVHGLHVGPFQGVEPTHRTVEFEQIHIFRIEDGMVAEHWACMDELAALRQIGVSVPEQ